MVPGSGCAYPRNPCLAPFDHSPRDDVGNGMVERCLAPVAGIPATGARLHPTGVVVTATTDITERFLAGDKAAVARVISWAENSDPRFASTLAALYPRVGHAYRTGITGP